MPAANRGAIAALVTNRPWTGAPNQIALLGAIIGGEQPSRYSASPRLWNGLFTRLKLPGFFCALDLPEPERLTELLSALIAIPACIDITITNPYKAAAYAALKSYGNVVVSERARHLGCVNHIVPHPVSRSLPDPTGRSLVADNTDGRGMVSALATRLREDADIALRGARILLVGAGSAAAAIGYELVHAGAVLTIANIEAEDAQRLGQQLRAVLPGSAQVYAGGWELLPQEVACSAAIVSAISAGTPFDASQLAAAAPLTICADVRYGATALFAKAAAAADRPSLDGREMLFKQFELAVEIAAPLWRLDTEALLDLLPQIRATLIGAGEPRLLTLTDYC